MNPEIITLDNGKKVAKMSLATHESYRNVSGEKVIETQWHNLVAWGKKAEIVEKFLKKGNEVAVEGKLITRTYNDKEGNRRFISEVIVSEVLLLGVKN